MATLNPFDLLGDDAEDPSQLVVSIAADKPKKHAPVSDKVVEIGEHQEKKFLLWRLNLFRSEEEVSKSLKYCNKYKVPIVPYGGATSIEGHTLAPRGGVRIDMLSVKMFLGEACRGFTLIILVFAAMASLLLKIKTKVDGCSNVLAHS